MATLKNVSFKEKACKTKDVSLLEPEIGAVVLNMADGRMYACDANGWHKFGDPYEPTP